MTQNEIKVGQKIINIKSKFSSFNDREEFIIDELMLGHYNEICIIKINISNTAGIFIFEDQLRKEFEVCP